MATDQMKLPEPNEHTGWILGALATAVATLWVTIKGLVTLQDKRNREDIDELKAVLSRRRNEITEVKTELADHRSQLADCVKDREELRVMCVRMETKLERIDTTSQSTHEAVERIDHRHEDEDAHKDQ